MGCTCEGPTYLKCIAAGLGLKRPATHYRQADVAIPETILVTQRNKNRFAKAKIQLLGPSQATFYGSKLQAGARPYKRRGGGMA